MKLQLKKPGIDHRKAVGGMWHEMGWFQLGYMVGAGLRPHHRLLDVGCGSMRGGMLFTRYLDRGNYWGFDKEQELVRAGWHVLARAALTGKYPHLHVVKNFDLSSFPDGLFFDFALAQSVFTHLLPDQILACLRAVIPRLKLSGELHATFFEGDDEGEEHPFREGERDIARYPFAMFQSLAGRVGATARLVGRIGHPRGQKMIVFEHKLKLSWGSRWKS